MIEDADALMRDVCMRLQRLLGDYGAEEEMDGYVTYHVPIGSDCIAEVESELQRLRDTMSDLEMDSVAREMVSQKIDGECSVLFSLGLFPTILTDGSVRLNVPGRDRGDCTVSEAAELTGMSEPRIRQLLTEEPQKIIGRKVGGTWMVDRQSALEYKRQRRPSTKFEEPK